MPGCMVAGDQNLTHASLCHPQCLLTLRQAMALWLGVLQPEASQYPCEGLLHVTSNTSELAEEHAVPEFEGLESPGAGLGGAWRAI